MNDWLNRNLGHTHLNPDPPNGIDGECVNAASSWSMAQGGPQFFGIGDSATAWTIFQTFRHPFYDVFQGAGGLRSGDIVFFFPNTPSAGTGSPGHVDVAVDQITGSGYRGADCNWNGIRSLQYVNHKYNGIAGYFRPKGGKVGDFSQEANDRQAALVRIGKAVSVDYKNLNDVDQIVANIHQLSVIIDQKDAQLKNQPTGDFVPVTEQLFKKKG